MPFSVAFGVLLSGGSPVDLDGTYFVQAALFLVAFLILYFLVFRPVMALFDAREQAVTGEKTRARQIESEAEEKREKFDDEIRSVRVKASKESERLRGEAQKYAREVMESARQNSEKLVAEAKVKLGSESAKIRQEVKLIVPGLARQIASKLLDREVN
ncbi:MAG: ATP synthase F0 subunit B [Deltaproteobacteria bacterium]|nr:ATP synthase F0 subunit B [Deltaproteobacteria bacterium]